MIWFNKNLQLSDLDKYGKNTMLTTIGMKFEEIGDDYLVMSMPVDHRTHQPMGLLHGGASAALAESIGSMAGFLTVDPEKQACVGIEINCNHVRGKKDGTVYAKTTPLYIGRTSQVWDIKITDEREKLICISRLTLAVVNLPQKLKD